MKHRRKDHLSIVLRGKSFFTSCVSRLCVVLSKYWRRLRNGNDSFDWSDVMKRGTE